MLDRTIRGEVSRISPEAPVPVIHVQGIDLAPGGCGNVTCNLAALGARPSLVSVCGSDSHGDQLRMELERRNINVSGLLVDPSRPTITKTRILAGRQQVARLDVEKPGPLSARHLKDFSQNISRIIRSQKAVIISDYGKGTVTRPVIRQTILSCQRLKIPIVVDPKVEHFMHYKGVDCITPNTKESVEGIRALEPKTESEFIKMGWKIIKTLRCQSLLITRGSQGMLLFQKGKKPQSINTLARDVFDVTGAGDTVVAVLTLARAVGLPYFEAAILANAAAGIVVEKVGTATVTPQELMRRIRSL